MHKLFNAIIRIFWAYPLVILGTFAVYIPGLFLWPLSAKARQKYIFVIWRIISFFYLRFSLFSKIIKIDSRSNQDEDLSGSLFIANHQSFADIPLIASYFRVSPLMKKEVLKIPGISLLASYARAITVGRNDAQSRVAAFKECLDRLKNKESVQYYPEGTRSKTGRPKNVDQIHKKLIEAAYERNIRVVPLSLYGTAKVVSPKYELDVFQTMGIVINEVVRPQDFESKDEFLNECWSRVCSGHEHLESVITRSSDSNSKAYPTLSL